MSGPAAYVAMVSYLTMIIVYLIVFFIGKKHGMALPISGRDMDASERRYYGRHK